MSDDSSLYSYVNSTVASVTGWSGYGISLSGTFNSEDTSAGGPQLFAGNTTAQNVATMMDCTPVQYQPLPCNNGRLPVHGSN